MLKILVAYILVIKCGRTLATELEYAGNVQQYDAGNVPQKQTCTPCNQNPWIPITSYYNKNKVIAYVHQKFYDQQNKEYGMKNLKQYFPKLEYPKPSLVPPSSPNQYGYNAKYLLPRPSVKFSNQQNFVKQDYYLPQSSNINNVQLNQHLAYQKLQNADFVNKYRAFISKALPPRVNYGPPFRAPVSYEKLQLSNLNQLMPPPQGTHLHYQLPLYMEPPHVVQSTVFDNSPQPTAFLNVPNLPTRNVEIIKSVPVIDYLATVEHPINKIYSPILDVEVANSSSVASEDDEHVAASNVNHSFHPNANVVDEIVVKKEEPQKKKEELRIPFSIQDLLMHKGALMAPTKYEEKTTSNNNKKVIIAPRKPNKIQIIIPYITNNSKLHQKKEIDKDVTEAKDQIVTLKTTTENPLTTEATYIQSTSFTTEDVNINEQNLKYTSIQDTFSEFPTELNSIQNKYTELQHLSTQPTPRLAPAQADPKEIVYVVTPLPMDTFNASYLNVNNENNAETKSNDVSLILSDWPHLINNLETSTVEHTTRQSTFGSAAPIFLNTYMNRIKTFSGHSKVFNTTPVFIPK